MALLSSSVYAGSISLTTTTNGTYLATTNRANVYQVELTSTTGATITLFDCESLAAPYAGTNYVNEAYTNRSAVLATNATSFVGYNGYTNWYTNVTFVTTNLVTAKNTNSLPVMGTFVVGANGYAIYNVDMLFVRGICARADTNASVVFNYRSSQ